MPDGQAGLASAGPGHSLRGARRRYTSAVLRRHRAWRDYAAEGPEHAGPLISAEARVDGGRCLLLRRRIKKSILGSRSQRETAHGKRRAMPSRRLKPDHPRPDRERS